MKRYLRRAARGGLRLLNQGLDHLGLELRRQASSAPAMSAVDYNARERVDALNRDPHYHRKQVSAERAAFFEAVLALAAAEGVALDGDVADIGCATGQLLEMIAAQASPSSLTGRDFSAAKIEHNQTLFAAFTFETYDLTEPSDRQFDAVFCLEVIEHIPRAAVALRNLIAMLRPGGALLITVPDGRMDCFVGHIHFWSPESWALFVAEQVPAGYDHAVGLVAENNYAIVRAPAS